MKRLIYLILLLLLLSQVYAVSACSYEENSIKWNCNNNESSFNIKPGMDANISFYCCLTGPELNSSQEYDAAVERVFNTTEYVIINNTLYARISYYPGTNFITRINYPLTVMPDADYPITIFFSIPLDADFSNDTVARVDIKVNTNSSYFLINTANITLRTPKSSALSDIILYIKNNYLSTGLGIILLALAYYYFVIRKKTE